MKKTDLKAVESILSYEFQIKALLIQALTRQSYGRQHQVPDSEVLEFLGDKVLNQIVTERLFKIFTKSNERGLETALTEHDLTTYVSLLVNNKQLASVTSKLNIVRYLRLGDCDVKNNVSESVNIKADLFEAIIGAVAIDSNYNWCVLNELIDQLFDINSYIKNGLNEIKQNSVGKLQEWFKKHKKSLPVYHFKESNEGKWTVYLDYDTIRFTGEGKTKIVAKKACALKVIKHLVNIKAYNSIKDEIGKPNVSDAINQLQELYQKGYYSRPIYHFEAINHNQNTFWHAEVTINSLNMIMEHSSSTKKDAKRQLAYMMLIKILNSNK